jgi:hypothetical protein
VELRAGILKLGRCALVLRRRRVDGGLRAGQFATQSAHIATVRVTPGTPRGGGRKATVRDVEFEV